MFPQHRCHRPLRTVAAALAAGLALPLLITGPAVGAPTAADRADRAATWESTQLRNGRIRNVQFDFPDWGLTLDTYFGLVAAGNRPGDARKVIRTVSANARKYVSFEGDFFAGSVAKLLLARRVAGLDASLGQENLQLRRKLERLVTASGRVSDSGADDFSNTIGQAFSVLAFARSGSLPPSTVRFLLRQQCDRGYFRLAMSSTSCDRDDSRADVDATGYALQALLIARREGVALPAGAVRDTAAWLRRVQRADGAFGGVGPTSGVNTNSTGLAAQALTAAGRDRAAAAAQDWIARLQLTRARTKGSPARKDLGAVAYNRADFKAARENGITRQTRDIWRRSTPQAISGLAPRPLLTLSTR